MKTIRVKEAVTFAIRDSAYGVRGSRIALALLGLLFLATADLAVAQSEPVPTIVFTKEFPGSQPDYFSLAVDEKGKAVYRIAPNDEAPVEFPLSANLAQQIFDLSRKLNLFREANLESNRRVANMGKKTLAYQNGSERYTATFNHTELPEALALAAVFEKLSTTQQHIQRLTYLIRFDRLGVVKELLQLESDLDQGRLLEPTLLVPLLEQVLKNRALVQVAHARAAQILAKIKAEESEPRPLRQAQGRP